MHIGTDIAFSNSGHGPDEKSRRKNYLSMGDASLMSHSNTADAKNGLSGHSVGNTIRILCYTNLLLVLSTTIIVVSLIWNFYKLDQEVIELARSEARTSINKDIIYRQWNASLGALYVKVTEKTPPNPYLTDLPERDITNADGAKFTMLNPTSMAKQVYALEEKELGIKNHLTSLSPVNPENAPDAWEQVSLLSFERGANEASSVIDSSKTVFLRLMRPLLVGKECLHCHQAYKIGEKRGGISVAINMNKYYAALKKFKFMAGVGHISAWLVCISFIYFGGKKLHSKAEELKIAREKADAANRAKSDLISMISHDVRNPMTCIIGMVDLAIQTDPSPAQKKYLDMVKQSSHSLMSILNDVLDLSKIEAGKLELEHRAFSLQEVIANSAGMFEYLAEKKGLALKHNTSPDVPLVLKGDPTRLTQVLANLLGNALKFTDRGSVELTVKCEKNEGENVILSFSVKDTAMGIPDNMKSKIFDSFTQADKSTARKYGGSGLGLAISQKLVHLMNGRMWVDSALGEGSTFYFTAQFGKAETLCRVNDQTVSGTGSVE